jgi:hypothetical protein
LHDPAHKSPEARTAGLRSALDGVYYYHNQGMIMTDSTQRAGHFANGEFRIGHVFSQSWSVLRQNILKIGVVTGAAILPLLLIPMALPVNIAGPLGSPGAIGPSGTDLSAFDLFTFFGSMAVFFVILLVVFNLSEAMVVYITVEHMRRKPINLVAGLKVALGRFFPLIGIVLLITLALMGLGLLSGIVAGVAAAFPGLAAVVLNLVLFFLSFVLYFMLIITWLVARPACVVERLGPLRSLRRSQELTRGHRWKLLGLLLLALACLLAVLLILGIVLGITTALGGTATFAGPLVQYLSLVLYAVVLAFFWILIAVIYRDLRVAREGIDGDQIATVFE